MSENSQQIHLCYSISFTWTMFTFYKKACQSQWPVDVVVWSVLMCVQRFTATARHRVSVRVADRWRSDRYANEQWSDAETTNGRAETVYGHYTLLFKYVVNVWYLMWTRLAVMRQVCHWRVIVCFSHAASIRHREGGHRVAWCKRSTHRNWPGIVFYSY